MAAWEGRSRRTWDALDICWLSAAVLCSCLCFGGSPAERLLPSPGQHKPPDEGGFVFYSHHLAPGHPIPTTSSMINPLSSPSQYPPSVWSPHTNQTHTHQPHSYHLQYSLPTSITPTPITPTPTTSTCIQHQALPCPLISLVLCLSALGGISGSMLSSSFTSRSRVHSGLSCPANTHPASQCQDHFPA